MLVELSCTASPILNWRFEYGPGHQHGRVAGAQERCCSKRVLAGVPALRARDGGIQCGVRQHNDLALCRSWASCADVAHRPRGEHAARRKRASVLLTERACRRSISVYY